NFERGYELKISNQTVWITSGLGVITSDLLEGNEQAGVKNHNTYHKCRNCMIHYSELDNVSFNTARYSRYHHKTTLQFSTIRRVQTQAQRDALAMQYGDLVKEMLQSTFEILSSKGETEFLKTAGFEKVLNDDLFAELRHAYKEELGCVEHLTSQT
ncbi:11849_t:CDS:2, partial [Funneliformis mosseae]